MAGNNLLAAKILRDSNTTKGGTNALAEQFPELYGAFKGLLGTAPDEVGGSVLDGSHQAQKAGAGYGFPIGLLANILPSAAPAINKTASILGKAAEPTVNAFVARTMANGGKPAQLLQDMAQGTQSKIFIGPKAKTWDAAAAAKAEEMLANGVAPRQIWSETLTGVGPDGMWRQEISDNAAAVQGGLSRVSHERMRDINGGKWTNENDFLLNHYQTPEAAAIRQRNSMTTGRVTDDTPTVSNVLSHPGLLGAYDDLGSIPVSIDHSMPIGNAALGKTLRGGDVVVMSPTDEAGSLSNLTHELQHAVQQREGFARGGSNDARGSGLTKENLMDWAKTAYERSHETSGDPLLEELFGGSKTWDQLTDREKLGWVGQARNDAYQALGGEAEARLTESRLGMTPEQRAAQYPWEPAYFEEATGVPVNGLLNLFDKAGLQASMTPKGENRLVGLLNDWDNGASGNPMIRDFIRPTKLQQTGIAAALDDLYGIQPRNLESIPGKLRHGYESRTVKQPFTSDDYLNWLKSAADDAAVTGTDRMGRPNLENTFVDPKRGTYTVKMPIRSDALGNVYVDDVIPNGIFK